jgi:hypothetical protein
MRTMFSIGTTKTEHKKERCSNGGGGDLDIVWTNTDRSTFITYSLVF